MASKVLIAEDNVQIAEVYKKLLENKGNDVTVTHDGQECLDVYKNEIQIVKNLSVNPFDVVLVDFAMPKKDGLTLITEILTKRPNQRVVFATAHLEKLRKQLHKIGKTVVVLNKPFRSKSLFEVIDTKTNELPKERKSGDGHTEWQKLSGVSDDEYWDD